MNRLKLVTTFCLLLFFYASSMAQGMHPDVQITNVKKQLKSKNKKIVKAYQQLIAEADKALAITNHALADFNIPGRYQEPELHKQNSQSLQTDAFNAYACALAYRLSDQEIYGQKACELLNAWGSINKKYSNYDGSLVMAYSAAGLLNAALLLKKQLIWKDSDKLQFDQWVIQVYNKSADEIRYRKNNWADWGRYASLLSASYLGNKDEIAKNAALIKSDVASKIALDGSMPEEVKRGENGIWYTYFSLAPLTASAWIIYNETGEDLFHQEFQKTTLKNALDYLLKYCNHPEDWPHFLNANKPTSKTGLDEWPCNLFEAMGVVYNDTAFVAYATKYRPIMYRKHHFAWTFPSLMPCEAFKKL